jgi:hypothetical protein
MNFTFFEKIIWTENTFIFMMSNWSSLRSIPFTLLIQISVWILLNLTMEMGHSCYTARLANKTKRSHITGISGVTYPSLEKLLCAHHILYRNLTCGRHEWRLSTNLAEYVFSHETTSTHTNMPEKHMGLVLLTLLIVCYYA